MNFKRNALLAIMGLVMAGGAVSTASADPVFHPRRAEVNERLAHQNHRIEAARHDGRLTAREARRLHRVDYHVRMQERRFARFHHGHISRFEQHRLNRQENRISHHIG
jgi:hypothetical protein